MFTIIILSIFGFCISLYTYLLEKKIQRVPSYKPMCDISDKISCTKPMKSAYASLFYVSNTLIAMIFYLLIFCLAFLQAQTLLLVSIICGCIASCILAYILYFKIKSLCLLCISLYVINFLLLFAVLKFIY